MSAHSHDQRRPMNTKRDAEAECPNCHERRLPHRACPKCGYFKGNTADAEQSIYDLRKKAGLYLQAGDTEEYNRILDTISNLQKTTGAVKGRGKEKDNDPTA